jgi:hypothetical protein
VHKCTYIISHRRQATCHTRHDNDNGYATSVAGMVYRFPIAVFFLDLLVLEKTA